MSDPIGSFNQKYNSTLKLSSHRPPQFFLDINSSAFESNKKFWKLFKQVINNPEMRIEVTYSIIKYVD